MAHVIDRAKFDAEVREMHVARYPEGCPGLCFDCIARLRIPRMQCPVCRHKFLWSRDGRVPRHQGKARGRRGYSVRFMRAFAPDCGGSGKVPAVVYEVGT